MIVYKTFGLKSEKLQNEMERYNKLSKELENYANQNSNDTAEISKLNKMLCDTQIKCKNLEKKNKEMMNVFSNLTINTKK